MSNRLEHANIRVRNIDETIRFLMTAFPDFRVRSDQGTGDDRWVHVGSDETYLALNQDSHEAARSGPGLNHLGFAVEETESLRSRLDAAGYHEGYIPPKPHPHHRRTYYHDGNGQEWEFVEYSSEKPTERNDYSF
jgi:catechol 2,3-dioxygenase-like lactoylglutathione lyase family enzyme